MFVVCYHDLVEDKFRTGQVFWVLLAAGTCLNEWIITTPTKWTPRVPMDEGR